MFLEQAHTGKNQWYLYVLTLLIVFTATQIGSLPLVAYMMYLDPASLQTYSYRYRYEYGPRPHPAQFHRRIFRFTFMCEIRSSETLYLHRNGPAANRLETYFFRGGNMGCIDDRHLYHSILYNRFIGNSISIRAASLFRIISGFFSLIPFSNFFRRTVVPGLSDAMVRPAL